MNPKHKKDLMYAGILIVLGIVTALVVRKSGENSSNTVASTPFTFNMPASASTQLPTFTAPANANGLLWTAPMQPDPSYSTGNTVTSACGCDSSY